MNDFYQAALAIAERKLAVDIEPSKLHSPRLGTGGDFKDIFLWDTAFSALWAKYHPERFPVLASLDNFYLCQEEDGFISRQITPSGRSKWRKDHPVSFGVPILGWVELELHLQGVGKTGRLAAVYPNLKRSHRFNQTMFRRADGLYFSDCFGCGMDDIPRWDHESEISSRGGIPLDRGCILTPGKEGDRCYEWMCADGRFHFDWNRQLVWCDTSCQMAFDALNLARIAEILGLTADAEEFRREHAGLAALINDQLYDRRLGFYFDRLGDRVLSRQHIGAFWALIAEVAPPERAELLVDALIDPKRFGRPCGIPSLAACDPDYRPESGYWRGPVWCPTLYMVLRGLQIYGYTSLARDIAG
ncbi:MAG: trehalase family glycosidase, partial [Victivallaceae bacterium]|nr:trehalase family glycosidase [Victivallaceae bacterium]